MYRPELQNRDKGGAIAAVIAIHAALLFVLLHLSGKIDVTDPQSVTRVFDVDEVPPPPEADAGTADGRQQTEQPQGRKGAASRENIKSQATPVVAPKPPIALPIPRPCTYRRLRTRAPRRRRARRTSPVRARAPAGLGRGPALAALAVARAAAAGIGTRAQPITRGPRGRDFPRHLRRLLCRADIRRV